MATLCGLTLVKRFNYRDIAQEEFSNKYWFKSAPPGDTASWSVLLSDLLALERPIFHGQVEFVRAYGYNDDDPKANSVFTHDYTSPGPPPVGTHPLGSGHMAAGDQAALVEWRTGEKNTRGKWIYLRKYCHAACVDPADRDSLETTYLGALQAYAGGIRTLHGGLTNPSSKASSPNGQDWPGGAHTAELAIVSPWITTRTLRRRGKRPKAS